MSFRMIPILITVTLTDEDSISIITDYQFRQYVARQKSNDQNLKHYNLKMYFIYVVTYFHPCKVCSILGSDLVWEQYP